MATITSSLLALLAAAPERSEPPQVETIPQAVLARPTLASSTAGPGTLRFQQQDAPPTGGTQATPEATPQEPAADAEGAAAPTEETDPDPRSEGGLVVDDYGALKTVPIRNIAGWPVPSSLPSAFPSGPRKGLLANVFSRRARLPARGGGPTPTGDWAFEYHGYFRAPAKFAIARRPLVDNQEQANPRSLHTPAIPDDQYLGYGYTTHHPRDWAELYFSYGNGVATGTVAIMGFNFSDSGWKENQTQFGIAQAFATLTPQLKVSWAKLMWKVGIFDNRYGGSGRYDAGELETYLFGRLHQMGEALSVDLSANEDFTVSIEHGVGTTRPDPSVYNDARFTLLQHAHVGFRYQNKVEFTVHWLNAFSNEADRITTMTSPETINPPAGSQHIVGPELRIDWGRLGFMYGGFSYINLKNGTSISRAIEVIHALGAGQFRHGLNWIYFGGADRGEVFSVIAQFENSIQKIRLGSNWYGQGPDLVAKFYFMVNKVFTDVPDDEIVPDDDRTRPVGDADGDLKYKVGFDLLGTPLPWLGIGFRTTHVAPDSDFNEQSFTIFSPRLVFRTNFITHETIELQYSRYLYGQRICPPDAPARCVQPPRNPVAPEGFGASQYTQEAETRQSVVLRGPFPYAPDPNVVMIKASIWW